MRLFHPGRLSPDYPFPLWAAGWLCLIKSTLWLCANASIPSWIFLAKYIVFSMAWLVLAYMIENRRRAGFYLLLALCFADMAFCIAYPQSIAAFGAGGSVYPFSIPSPELLISSWFGSLALLLMSPLIYSSMRPSG